MSQKVSILLTAAILAGSPVASLAQSSKKVTTKVANAEPITAQVVTSANTTTLKLDDMKKPDEKTKDIDEEITDARLRAQLGSKSQWSFQSSLAYSGGSIQDPLGAVRPNYRASATIEAMTSLAGNVGVNYRAGNRDNISFGTGITVIDPLHGDITKSAEDTRTGRSGTLTRYEVSTPYIGWSRGYRAFDAQMVSGLTYGHATDSDSVNLSKTLGSVSFNQTILANFGTSKWTGGASISLVKSFYTGYVTDSKLLASMAVGAYKRLDMNAGIFPFAQYTFNDRYSFRTVFGYFQFAQYKGSNKTPQMEPYQSVGVGVSITRDIYLYPNVQFTPKDIRADRTNVALSANINLF